MNLQPHSESVEQTGYCLNSDKILHGLITPPTEQRKEVAEGSRVKDRDHLSVILSIAHTSAQLGTRSSQDVKVTAESEKEGPAAGRAWALAPQIKSKILEGTDRTPAQLHN